MTEQNAEREAAERAEPGAGLGQPTEDNAFPGASQAEPVDPDAPLEPGVEGDRSEANAQAAEAQGGATGDQPEGEPDDEPDDDDGAAE